ncbi:hypothetical protein [Streptomyces sp. NPDC007905]|uniref:hypothetical protein n=1 Tax=Streptomyces sp. NPDC007905 TaxID=3364788 RepID=UPI0036E48A73
MRAFRRGRGHGSGGPGAFPGAVLLVSSNGLSRYEAGSATALPAVAGHNDGHMTSCPGAAVTARLPEIRERAALLRGRTPTGTPQATHRAP